MDPGTMRMPVPSARLASIARVMSRVPGMPGENLRPARPLQPRMDSFLATSART